MHHFARALCLVILGFGAGASAATAGEVVYLTGTLSARSQDGINRLLNVRSQFSNVDVLSTAQESFARVRLIDETEIALRPNTVLDISEIVFADTQPESDRVTLELLKGGLRTVTGLIGRRNAEKVRFETPVGSIGIRGTHFGLLLCQSDCQDLRTLSGAAPREGLHLDVADGRIEVTNAGGTLILEAGQFAYVADAGTAPVLVDEQDAYRNTMPACVLFEGAGQLWADGVLAGSCAVR